MLKEVLEPRLPKKGVTKPTLSEGEKVLRELRQGLIDNILKTDKKAEQRARVKCDQEKYDLGHVITITREDHAGVATY
jgi:hypothetical protein